MTFTDTILSADLNLLVYRSDTLEGSIFFFEDEARTIDYTDLEKWDELKLTVRENYDSLKEIIVLTLGNGLTVSGNELTLLFSSEQMNLLRPDFVFDIEGKTGITVGTVLRGLFKRDNDVTK